MMIKMFIWIFFVDIRIIETKVSLIWLIIIVKASNGQILKKVVLVFVAIARSKKHIGHI